jgi:hypothetical protein
MARGEGPSVSREMFNQATNRNIAAQNAFANSGRGNASLNAMVAMNNAGRLGAEASQGAALGRVQEQNNAINNLGMQLYSARGADEETNRFNANAYNYNNLNRAQLQNQFNNMQDSAMLGGMAQYRPQPSPADLIMGAGGQLGAFMGAQGGNNTNRQAPAPAPPELDPRLKWWGR